MVSWRDHRKFVAALTVFTIAQLVIISLKWGKPLVWDSTVYIGMGKYLYSLGEVGYWESFRPPVMPIIMGALWKIGVPMADIPRIIALVFSITGVTAFYAMVSDLYSRKKGLYAALMLVGTYTFFWWTPYLLTGIPASIMIFTAVYLAMKERLFLSGLVAGLAFLTRFPSALVAAGIGGYFILQFLRTSRKAGRYVIVENLRDLLWKSFRLSAGFVVLAVPYFVISYFFFGNPLHPIIKGATVPAGNPAKYMYGFYFLYNAVRSNPLLALAPLSLVWTIKERKKTFYLPALVLGMFYCFFTFYPHKLTRFLLIFLPFMALFTAEGISRMEERIRNISDFEYFEEAVLVVSIVMMLVSASYAYNLNNWENPSRENYLDQAANFTGTVASNTPNMITEGDFRFIPVRPETMKEDFSQAESQADYYMVNSCSWYCTPAIDNCQEKIDNFTQTIKERHELIFETGINECNYSIYEVKR